MINKEVGFLLKHSGVYGLGAVISRVVAFILLPLYTRYLTPSDYGILQLVDITTGIIAIVVTVGITRALSRFYYEFENQKDKDAVISTTFITYLVISLSLLPILLAISKPLAGLLLKEPEYSHFFKITFITLIFGGLTSISITYLRVIKKSLIFMLVTLAKLLLLITLNVVFIVYYGLGILGILYSALFVGIFFSLALTVAILWKIKVKFSFKIASEMLQYSLPLIPSSLANVAVKQSDKYFLLYFTSTAEVGIYALAMRIGTVIHTLLTIPFNMAYIPRRFEIMKKEDAKEIYTRIYTYYSLLIIFMGLVISVTIPEILQIMVTPQFYAAGKYVPLIVFSMIIFGSHYHFDFGILYSKKTKYLAYINFGTALINIGLNYVLISQYGLWGGVISSVIVLGIQAYLLFFMSHKFFKIDYEFGRITKYILLAFLFYAMSTQINFNILLVNLALKFLLLLLFPVLVYFFRLITVGERDYLKAVWRNVIRKKFV